MAASCSRCGYSGWLYDHPTGLLCSGCWNVVEIDAAQKRGERRLDLRKKRIATDKPSRR